jgi:hypothetical protein
MYSSGIKSQEITCSQKLLQHALLLSTTAGLQPGSYTSYPTWGMPIILRQAEIPEAGKGPTHQASLAYALPDEEPAGHLGPDHRIDDSLPDGPVAEGLPL